MNELNRRGRQFAFKASFSCWPLCVQGAQQQEDAHNRFSHSTRGSFVKFNSLYHYYK